MSAKEWEELQITKLSSILNIEFEIVTKIKTGTILTVDKTKDGKWRLIYSEEML